MMSQRCLRLSVVLLLSACMGESPASSSAEAAPAMPAGQVGSAASAVGDKCPLRPADLDKLTPYRWQIGQYRADRGFFPDPSIRIDMCELIGRDAKGVMRSGVMVNIARGAHAEAFAKHWHAACADSIQQDMRGKVQPVGDVPGGRQCVTPSGSSSFYWIESPGRTVQVELENDDAALATTLPRLLGAVVR